MGEPITPIAPFAPIPGAPGIVPIPGNPPIPVVGPIIAESAPPAETMKLKNKAARSYFLPPDNQSDRMKFRPAPREIHKVTPFIDGEDIFKEFEKAIEAAEKSVLIAFWAFDPLMRLKSDSGLTWTDLLIDAAMRDVMVRILWTDFDPALQPDLHVSAWMRYGHLMNAASGVSTDKFQLLCVNHPAQVPAAVVAAMQTGLYDGLAKDINLKSADEIIDIFNNAPGTWDKLKLVKGKVQPIVKGKDYNVWAGVHHQKLVIVDGKFGYAGGVNILNVYDDTKKHLKPVMPWHDAFVKVEGSFVLRDLTDNFIGLWNEHRPRMEAFLKTAFSKKNIKATATIGTSTDLNKSMLPIPLNSTAAPSIPCQMRRTVSGTSNALGIPQNIRKDILEGYILAIQQATKYIYIENQYFREKLIGDAIVARHAVATDLRTIIVMPREAEELMNGKADRLSNHGAALQYKIFEEMKTKLKDKLGLYMMVRNDAVAIYVHSKLMLIDDKFASIGSANSNPRSYRVDTELDLVWYDEKSVKKLREDLWNEVLGKPSDMGKWKSTDYISKWTAIASKNTTAGAGKQKGFVFPFENKDEGDASLFPIDIFT